MKINRQGIRKILKIAGILLVVLVIFILGSLYRFVKPVSDTQIFKKFEETNSHPYIIYKDFQDHRIRVITMQKKIDTTLPVIVFVHGSPGNAMDFFRYLSDPELSAAANIIAYDRIGYSRVKNEQVVKNIDTEAGVLHTVCGNLPKKKIILLGYSYGGTVVMADPANYKAKIVLAPSVRGDYEPQFWLLNLYKWKLTRPLLPRIFQNAATEKLRHIHELDGYKTKWTLSGSPVIDIHGDKDRIVTYKNSLFLQKIFPENQFKLIVIPAGTHALVWTDFGLIKEEILAVLKGRDL